jgi:hypothetical protein
VGLSPACPRVSHRILEKLERRWGSVATAALPIFVRRYLCSAHGPEGASNVAVASRGDSWGWLGDYCGLAGSATTCPRRRSGPRALAGGIAKLQQRRRRRGSQPAFTDLPGTLTCRPDVARGTRRPARPGDRDPCHRHEGRQRPRVAGRRNRRGTHRTASAGAADQTVVAVG